LLIAVKFPYQLPTLDSRRPASGLRIDLAFFAGFHREETNTGGESGLKSGGFSRAVENRPVSHPSKKQINESSN